MGKTTTSINLAACLARSGRQTLLVDMDPQCNATTGLGHHPVDHHPLVGEEALRHHVLDCEGRADCNLLARQSTVSGRRFAEQIWETSNHNESSSNFETCTGLFDYVLIDCPPSMGRLTQTALSSSDEVLMPIQCEYFAMEGLKQMIEVIRDVMQRGSGSTWVLPESC